MVQRESGNINNGALISEHIHLSAACCKKVILGKLIIKNHFMINFTKLKILLTAMASLAIAPVFSQAPANDDCSGAIAMTCGDTLTGSTAAATVSTAPICAANLELVGPAVWYSFTGTGDAIEVSLCHAGTNYDSKIVVYSGSCGALTCVTGNDDAGGACGLQSIAYFTSTLGTTYYFAVSGYQTNVGDFQISVDCSAPCTPVPANDDCATAESLVVASDTASCVATNGTNTCAGISFANPSCAQFINCQDVWYTFNSGANTSILVDFEEITGTGFGYALYDGCGNVDVACGGLLDGLNVIGVTASTTYWLQVFTDGGVTAGDFSICLSDGPPAPYNDDCANATLTPIVNGNPPVTINGTTFGGTGSVEEQAAAGQGATMVWEAITLTECADLTIDYCGTVPVMPNPFVVYTDCQFTNIVFGNVEFTTCPDGNGTITWTDVPAGTHYIPINADTQGPYTINISAVDCVAGLDENLEAQTLKIFPNPASDMIHFNSDNLEGMVTIVNTYGAVVLRTELKEAINVAELPNGVYLVSVQNEDTIRTEKLIIKR
jgi:hypothetical protein